LEIAKGLNLPPYVIFHDSALMTMAELKPQTQAQMLSISGVGEVKLELYGADFLEILPATR
jgi:ATP-dependent DNA helicase RecQ